MTANTIEHPDSNDQSVAARTPMLLDLDRLVPYDYNPRQVVNAHYDRIRESIRINGLDQVLVVTQRPSPDDPSTYMMGAGGNTRLRALKELHAETDDARFARVWCQYRPWQGEPHTLIANIRENEDRGDLLFIERALAIRNLRYLLEQETAESLSQRAFSDALRQRGYRISQTLISWYDYAVDTLFAHIPAVLFAGLGRHRIEKIHNLERAFKAAAETLSPDDPLPTDELFTGVLRRHDAEILDLFDLRRDLESELAVSTDLSLNYASMIVSAHLDGSMERAKALDPSADFAHPRAVQAPPDESADDDKTATTAPAAASPDPGSACARNDALTHAASAPETGAAEPSNLSSDAPGASSDGLQPDDQPDPGLPGDYDAAIETCVEPSTDLKSLRSRAWTLAAQLAQGAGLGDIIQPIATGSGYLVGPLSPTIVEAASRDDQRTVNCVWWHLAMLSEQFADHGMALAVMPAHWHDEPIGQAMRIAYDGAQSLVEWQSAQNDPRVRAQVPLFEPDNAGTRLYNVWTGQQWQTWTALVETYRTIHNATRNQAWGE